MRSQRWNGLTANGSFIESTNWFISGIMHWIQLHCSAIWLAISNAKLQRKKNRFESILKNSNNSEKMKYQKSAHLISIWPIYQNQVKYLNKWIYNYESHCRIANAPSTILRQRIFSYHRRCTHISTSLSNSVLIGMCAAWRWLQANSWYTMIIIIIISYD